MVSPTQLAVTQVHRRSSDARLVLLGEQPADGEVPHVMIDNVASSIDVMRHLVSTGRRRIGFIGAPTEPRTTTGSRRFEGYRTVLRFAELESGPDLIRRSRTWNREEGYRMATDMLADNVEFDALVCANDLLAIGAAAALTNAGLRVPQDVALTGWDDIDEAAWAVPPLTTVAPDINALVSTAFDAAVAKDVASIGGPEFTIDHELIIRESSSSRAP